MKLKGGGRPLGLLGARRGGYVGQAVQTRAKIICLKRGQL